MVMFADATLAARIDQAESRLTAAEAIQDAGLQQRVVIMQMACGTEPVRVELSILAHPAIGEVLTGRGYRLHRFDNVLGRSLKVLEPPKSSPELTVEVLQEEDAATWMDIAVTSFSELDGTGTGADDSISREPLAKLPCDWTEAWLRFSGRGRCLRIAAGVCIKLFLHVASPMRRLQGAILLS
jgi:hypothetical protein